MASQPSLRRLNSSISKIVHSMRHGKVQSVKTEANYSLLKSALPAMEARQISPAQRSVIASGVPRGEVLRREM